MSVNNTFKKLLACPICYKGLKWTQNAGLSELQCSICKMAHVEKETHLDLNIASGGKTCGESMPASTELFRIPFISYLYERGWRQSFSWGGFPGPEKEFELIKDYLKPVLGGNILDASCGSGLFSRLFAKSGLFSAVVALDYSESMLQQCSNFMEQDENFPQEGIMLVRADISRLPFVTSSLDAVHAGAALHCWPSPSAAVAEISRVLRPGGMFVASTFLFDGRYTYVPFAKTIRQVKFVDSDVEKTMKQILACPICYSKLTWTESIGRTMRCGICKKSYFYETHLDLSIASGAKSYGEHMATSNELFRIPLVSYLYERGWRQSFKIGGFPGLEKEFVFMKEYLKPSFGGTIIDASCGSGLFSRLFARSGLFSLVVALDYSESMLKQCHNFIKEEESFPQKELMLVRADISRLPFITSSVDAVHAGAALHCWPSPSGAVAEISRVLRPGGIFVATTFIFNRYAPYIPLIKTARQCIKHLLGGFFFLSKCELEDLCSTCGLVNFKYFQIRSFVMISAMKPK